MGSEINYGTPKEHKNLARALMQAQAPLFVCSTMG